MNFREWLFSEVGIADAPMQLKQINGYDAPIYAVDFNHEGTDFSVHFTGRAESEYPNTYSIGFYGPSGTSTTGLAGTKASGVYSKVMAAVNTFLKQVQVTALQFSPAEPGMQLVYQKLFDRMGNEFVRTDLTTYVKRDYLKKNLDKMGQYNKQSSSRFFRRDNQRIRQEKNAMRQMKQNLKPGGFIGLKIGGGVVWPAYLLGFQGEYAQIIYVNSQGTPNYHPDVTIQSLDEKEPDQNQIQRLVQGMNYGVMSDVFPSDVVQKITPLFSKYMSYERD